MTSPLSALKRVGVEFLDPLRSDQNSVSVDHAKKLIAEASEFGLGMKDYLLLKVDPRLSANENDRNALAQLDGYEAALARLNLPIRDDFKNGIVLQAASETFQTFPGARALFPQVVDDMVHWKYRQDLLEKVEPMIANSRTINGVEMLTTVVDDKQEDYQATRPVAEASRIPVKSIRATEYAVKIWKHGQGYRTTYEFERRASLDMLVPYANRAQREMEISKVGAATSLLINGDGANGAAPVVNQSSFNNANTVGTSVNGQLSYKHLLAWLVSRARAGTPIDTVVGNWDAYILWLFLFALPGTTANNPTDAQNLAGLGYQIGGVPLLKGNVQFVLSSTAPANRLIGFSRGDTIEELVEAGSLIQESDRSVVNQTISYYKTENTGYRIVFGDTRSIYNFGA